MLISNLVRKTHFWNNTHVRSVTKKDREMKHKSEIRNKITDVY